MIYTILLIVKKGRHEEIKSDKNSLILQGLITLNDK